MINIDLNIIDGDITLNEYSDPKQLHNNDVIAQDIKHRIIESGKLPLLIGLRNKNSAERVLTELELIIEQDERLQPGTIKLIRATTGYISVSAQTRKDSQ